MQSQTSGGARQRGKFGMSALAKAGVAPLSAAARASKCSLPPPECPLPWKPRGVPFSVGRRWGSLGWTLVQSQAENGCDVMGRERASLRL